jgi:hypothetical protein
MMSTGIDAALAERVRRGDYVVDAEAVAEAMMRRWLRAAWPQALGSAECARIASPVLVAAQPLDGPSAGVDEDQPAAGADAA